MYRPLDGIKVVDFCLAGAGPSCTKQLTEFGADTIWVEPLKGSSTRDVHKFDFYTTGKRAITLNLKSDKGMDVMLRLIKEADVFVTNYRPNAVRRLGLGYDDVKVVNPRIVYASLTGFGEIGPDANNAGYVKMPNVDLPVEMMSMVTASRMYQANAAVLKRHMEGLDQTLELLK